MVRGFPLALKPNLIEGIDVLGLAMQDINMLASLWRNKFALGVLEGTFGSIEQPLRQMLDTGKIPMVRVHLTNGPCERNHNCEPGEPGPLDFPEIRKRAAMVQGLATLYPAVKFYISPRLEHDVKDPTVVKRWLNILDKEAPKCIAVISAYTGVFSKEALVEKHGEEAKAAFISADGDSSFDINWTRFRKGARLAAFSWIPECNLRTENGPFIPPSKRKNKLTEEQLIRLFRMMGEDK